MSRATPHLLPLAALLGALLAASAVLPSVSADHSLANATLELFVQKPGAPGFVKYDQARDGALPVGTKVRFDATITVNKGARLCTNGGNINTEAKVWVKSVLDADEESLGSQTGDGLKSFSKEFELKSKAKDVGRDGLFTFSANFNSTCGLLDTADKPIEPKVTALIDNVLPDFTVDQTITRRESPPSPIDANEAGVNDTLKIRVTSTEAAGEITEVKLDLSAIGFGTKIVALASEHSFKISDNVTAIDPDATVGKIRATVKDNAGNSNEKTSDAKVDNRRPSGDPKIDSTSSKLVGTANAMDAKVFWYWGSGSSDMTGARVTISPGGTDKFFLKTGSKEDRATIALDKATQIGKNLTIKVYRADDAGNNENVSSKTISGVPLVKILSHVQTSTDRIGLKGIGNVTIVVYDDNLNDSKAVQFYLKKGEQFWKSGTTFESKWNEHVLDVTPGVAKTFTDLDGISFSSGDYVLGITAKDKSNNEYNFTVELTVDSRAPVKADGTKFKINAPKWDSNNVITLTQGLSKVNYSVSFTDKESSDSGIGNVTLHLVTKDNNNLLARNFFPLFDGRAGSVSAACRKTSGGECSGDDPDTTRVEPDIVTAVGSIPDGKVEGNVHVENLPYAPLGTYKLAARGYDDAGNHLQHTFTAYDVRIIPRIHLVDNKDSPKDTNGRINFTFHGAWESYENIYGNCTYKVGGKDVVACQLDATVQVRKKGEQTWRDLKTLLHSGAAPEAVNGSHYWKHVLDSVLLPEDLRDPDVDVEVRVKVATNPKLGAGTDYFSKALQVKKKSGAITPKAPSTDWSVWTFQFKGDKGFGTFEFKASATVDAKAGRGKVYGDEVAFNYSIIDVAKRTTVETDHLNETWDKVGGKFVEPKSPFNFTWKNKAPLKAGEYRVLVQLKKSNTSGEVVDERAFLVAVQEDLPSVEVVKPGKKNASEIYSKPPFYAAGPKPRLDLEIRSHFVNLTSKNRVSFALLDRGVGNWIPEGPAFRVDRLNSSGFLGNKSLHKLNVTLHLPEADDGKVWALFVNVTADGRLPCVTETDFTSDRYRCWQPNTSFLLQLDKTAPAITFRPETRKEWPANASLVGDCVQGGPRILLRATDAGTGVDQVSILLYNKSDNRTLTNGRWIGGNLTAREDYVNFTPKLDSKGDFAFCDPAIMKPMSPLKTYVVGVLGRDVAGNEGGKAGQRPPEFIQVNFDPRSPQLHVFERLKPFDPGNGGTPENPRYGYRGLDVSGTRVKERYPEFNATVSDDFGVKRVVLHVKYPSGWVGEVPMRNLSALRAYGQPGFTADMNVTFRGELRGGALNQTGAYEISLKAYDHAGNATLGKTVLKLHVVDNHAPEILSIVSEPDELGVGSELTVTARIDEDTAIAKTGGVPEVTILLLKDGEKRIGPFPMTYKGFFDRAINAHRLYANGTGEWTWTNRGGLDLEVGTYILTVRANDTSRHSTENDNAFFHVKELARPQILARSPETGGGFVNASPRIHLFVVSPRMDPSRITVRAGNSTENLTEVAASQVEKVIARNSTGGLSGYDVHVRLTELLDGAPVLVNVTARDNNSLLAIPLQLAFTVDALPPEASHAFEGIVTLPDGRIWLSGSSKVTLAATDAGSGVASIRYRVNGGAPIDYDEPFAIPVADGEVVVNYTATDRAGLESAASGFVVSVDSTPPSLTLNGEGPTVLVSVSDGDGIGINPGDVSLFYTLSPTQPYKKLPMLQLPGNAYYRADIPENTTEGLRYHFEALDRLGNKGTKFSAGAPHVVNPGETPPPDPGPDPENPPPPGNETNAAPTVRFTAPLATGPPVKGQVLLKWTADDADGDALTFTLAYRRSDGQGQVLEPLLGSTVREFAWDVAALEDGAYTVVLTVSDGRDSAEASLALQVKNTETIVPKQLPAPRLRTGESAQIGIEIVSGKPVQNVRAIIVSKASGVREPVAMTRTGTTNIYGVTYQPQKAGNYEVLVEVTYLDGSKDSSSLSSFAVQGDTVQPAPKVLTAPFIGLLAAGVATLALAGAGAWRWRK